MKEAKKAVNTVGGLAVGEVTRNEIPEALDCLEKRIESLSEAVTTLAGCVQPAMRDSDPKPEKDAQCGSSTAMGGHIRVLEMRVSGITETINDMVERIEL